MVDISSGFQTSSTETIMFLVVLGVVILGLIGYQLYMSRTAGKRRERKRRERPTEPVLKQRSRTRRDLINLNRSEQATLDHLSWFLKDPSRQDRLIDDDRLLVRIARQAIREGLVTESAVLRLLRKLEVDHEALTVGGRSSESIPGGAEISISDRNLNIATGHLLLSAQNGLRVRLDKGHRAISGGSHVEVVAGGAEGMYRFHSLVLERSGKELTLQHSQHVERVQRRKYRRRDLQFPAVITMPGIDDRPLKTETQDLSIGGAALKNPKKRVMTGSIVEIVLEPGGSTPMTLQGTAVRTSRKGKTVHVSFSNMNDDTRHKLFRKLIRAGRGQQ